MRTITGHQALHTSPIPSRSLGEQAHCPRHYLTLRARRRTSGLGGLFRVWTPSQFVLSACPRVRIRPISGRFSAGSAVIGGDRGSSAGHLLSACPPVRHPIGERTKPPITQYLTLPPNRENCCRQAAAVLPATANLCLSACPPVRRPLNGPEFGSVRLRRTVCGPAREILSKLVAFEPERPPIPDLAIAPKGKDEVK